MGETNNDDKLVTEDQNPVENSADSLENGEFSQENASDLSVTDSLPEPKKHHSSVPLIVQGDPETQGETIKHSDADVARNSELQQPLETVEHHDTLSEELAPAKTPVVADTATQAEHVFSPVMTLQDGVEVPVEVPADDDAEDPNAHLSIYDQLMHKLFSAQQLALNSTPVQRFWGWMAPLLLALLGGVIRFFRLGTPNSLVFDETYYVKGGYTLLKEGFEADWPDEIDDTWNAGNLDVYLQTPDYVVHPPLGKWMIAFGMWLSDPHDPTFWRLSTALVSVIAIFLIARTVRTMTGSLTFGLAAGALFAIDGTAIVHARTGLLDSFLMFWVIVSFALLVKDRMWRRERLASLTAGRLELGLELTSWGPRLGWSWWRFAAALTLGLSCGIKWSGLYYVAAFCLMAVIWDWGARKAIGAPKWFWGGFWRDAVPSALIMLPTALAGYLLAWASWFTHAQSYGRLWFMDNPGTYPSWTPDWVVQSGEGLRSLWHYHVQMWDFHTGLTSEHTYEANPWGWLLQIRPTSFYWRNNDDGTMDCFGDECVAAITSVGNPLIWWLATVALIILVIRVFTHKDWIAGGIVAGVAAGWVPWLFTAERTIFTFYTIAFAPFMCMALAYLGYVIWQYLGIAKERKVLARTILISVGSLILLVSVFFYPVWTAIPIPKDFWQVHMWLQSWI